MSAEIGRRGFLEVAAIAAAWSGEYVDGETSTFEKGKATKSAANSEPTASFAYAPSDPVPDETVTFDGSGSSDPDGSVQAYEWDFDGDGSYDVTGLIANHTYGSTGDYQVELRVTDDDGAVSTTTSTVSVSGSNARPTANLTYSPSDPVAGEAVSFDGGGSSDPDGRVVAYEWDLDGDGTYDTTGTTVAHAFDSPGDYPVTLRVEDDDGARVTATTTVTVSAVGPTASFSVSAGGDTTPPFDVDQPVTLDASGSSDPNGRVVAYEWDLNGDGSYALTGRTVTLSFSSPGDKTITLRVTDDDGNAATTSRTVTISDSPEVGEYTGSDDVIDTGDLQDAIVDWVRGDVDTGFLQDVIQYWVTGDPVT